LIEIDGALQVRNADADVVDVGRFEIDAFLGSGGRSTSREYPIAPLPDNAMVALDLPQLGMRRLSGLAARDRDKAGRSFRIGNSYSRSQSVTTAVRLRGVGLRGR
jgi:hypothetical protein